MNRFPDWPDDSPPDRPLDWRDLVIVVAVGLIGLLAGFVAGFQTCLRQFVPFPKG